MFTFQSTYRTLDLNFGKKVLRFNNFVLMTSDADVADFLRRHAERNPNDVWELVAPEAPKEEPTPEPDDTGKPVRRGRPPKGVKTFRGTRSSEVMEQTE